MEEERTKLSRSLMAAIAAIALLAALDAHACTCAGPVSDSKDAIIEAYCTVDVVFTGIAEELSTDEHGSTLFRLDPKEVLRGTPPRPALMEVYSTCDNYLSDDESYLIFGQLDRNSRFVRTSICGPTRFTGRLNASEDLLLLIQDEQKELVDPCDDLSTQARRARLAKERRRLGTVDPNQLIDETQSQLQDNEHSE